jgi:TrmH family RNA methyltransferase
VAHPYAPRTVPISQNQLKYYRLLLIKKYRTRDRKFLVEGVRCIEEALAAGAALEAVVIAPQAMYVERALRLMQALEQAGVTLLAADRRAFRTIADTAQSQGLVAVARWPYEPFAPEQFAARGILVALNGVADPGNAGTIVRTCAWFGVQGVLCDRTTVDTTNPKTVRSTAGAIFHVPVYDELDISSVLPQLRERGFALYYADVRASTALEQIVSAQACVVVLGSEASGIDPALAALCDRGVRIERYGAGDSLNVAVAAGIILAHFAKLTRRQEPHPPDLLGDRYA